MAHDKISRRRFFFYGSLLAGSVPLAGSGYGRTPSLTALGYKSPNEKLNIASIGAGGKARSDIEGCARTENIVALCDVDAVSAAQIFDRYPDVPKYNDYRKMLDKEAKNIDAVIIAIPDFMHTCAAMACMELGKHVYVQKPMARTVWECRALTQAARYYKVATQMGNQGYAQDGTRLCAEFIWSGLIGDVKEVHAFTNRPIWPQGPDTKLTGGPVPATLNWDAWLGVASERPYMKEYLPFNWRGFYDFGCGALGDMACHVLGAPNLALRLTAPTSVECIKIEGQNEITFPTKSTIKFEFPARGAMPALTLYWEDGEKNGSPYRPEGLPPEEPLGEFSERNIPGPIYTALNAVAAARAAALRGAGAAGGRAGAPAGGRAGAPAGGARPSNQAPRPPSSGSVFIGDKGVITAGEYGGGPRLVPMSKMEDVLMPPQMLDRTPGTYNDWLAACKGGEPACSNFDIAGPFTEWIALGVVACRIPNTKLIWDPVKMKITNNAAANAFLTPKIRKGWKINWNVKT
jgi:predicted dehydrogenase